MYRYHIVYVVGNTYKSKFIIADNTQSAIKKARVKNIVDIFVEKVKGE